MRLDRGGPSLSAFWFCFRKITRTVLEKFKSPPPRFEMLTPLLGRDPRLGVAPCHRNRACCVCAGTALLLNRSLTVGKRNQFER